MFKTIFAKQFTAFICTMFIFALSFGVGMSGMFRGYFFDQKEKILKEQGEKIATYLSINYIEIIDDFVYDRRPIEAELQSISEYIDISLLVMRPDFSIIELTNNIETLEYGDTLQIPALESVMQGETPVFQGKVKGVFDEGVLIVAIPMVKGTQIKGCVLMISSITELNENMHGVTTLAIKCMLIASLVSFVFIYIVSRTMSKPIHQINNAAKVVANGNFEKRLSVQSQDEIGQLAESFNHMAKSLEDQEKQRTEFISNISHDLRSPLTSMQGFLQAIIDGTIPEENKDRYLHIVLEETYRLSKLANDILDINKIQNLGSDLIMTEFDLNELIRKTVIMFETKVTKKEIKMSVLFEYEKTNIWADYDKMHRIVYNLIDNAVKFTDYQGHISIETFTKNEKVYVRVKDDGEGISDEAQKRVFERFYKIDSSRGRDKSGSGLGLSIVKEFVKIHGGDITLTSAPKEGCEFLFWINKSMDS